MRRDQYDPPDDRAPGVRDAADEARRDRRSRQDVRASRRGTNRPRCRRSAARRAPQQLGTVGRLAHEAFVSDEVGALLEELRPYGESLDHDSFEASLIRVVQRDYDKSVRVPPELSAEITRAGSRAFGVWVEARTRSDYELFRPALEEMVELKHRYVDCFPPAEDPYDTLLDDYEPGMKAAEVRSIFDRLKEELIPLIEAARSSATPPVPGHFPAATQRQLSLEVLQRFGFERHRVADRHRAAPVRDVALDERHPDHDA